MLNHIPQKITDIFYINLTYNYVNIVNYPKYHEKNKFAPYPFLFINN